MMTFFQSLLSIRIILFPLLFIWQHLSSTQTTGHKIALFKKQTNKKTQSKKYSELIILHMDLFQFLGKLPVHNNMYILIYCEGFNLHPLQTDCLKDAILNPRRVFKNTSQLAFGPIRRSHTFFSSNQIPPWNSSILPVTYTSKEILRNLF